MTLRTRLSAGLSRGLGCVTAVVDEIFHAATYSPAKAVQLVAELVDALDDPRPLVTIRAANALDKVQRQLPAEVAKHSRRLLRLASASAPLELTAGVDPERAKRVQSKLKASAASLSGDPFPGMESSSRASRPSEPAARFPHPITDLRTRWNLIEIIGRLPLKGRDRALAIDLLFEALASSSGFLRAFALTGLFHHAKDDASLKRRLQPVLDNALEDSSPAVRARARRLLKKLPKT